MASGEYIIGVFNMNYYVNSNCDYSIVVSTADDRFVMVTPSFMSIILVVIMSMFLCLLLSVGRCKLKSNDQVVESDAWFQKLSIM